MEWHLLSKHILFWLCPSSFRRGNYYYYYNWFDPYINQILHVHLTTNQGFVRKYLDVVSKQVQVTQWRHSHNWRNENMLGISNVGLILINAMCVSLPENAVWRSLFLFRNARHIPTWRFWNQLRVSTIMTRVVVIPPVQIYILIHRRIIKWLIMRHSPKIARPNHRMVLLGQPQAYPTCMGGITIQVIIVLRRPCYQIHVVCMGLHVAFPVKKILLNDIPNSRSWDDTAT